MKKKNKVDDDHRQKSFMPMATMGCVVATMIFLTYATVTVPHTSWFVVFVSFFMLIGLIISVIF